jgi:circadian clock protein KaiA
LVAPLQIYILTRGDQVKQDSDLPLDPARYTISRIAVYDDTPNNAWEDLNTRVPTPDCLVVDGQLWQQVVLPTCQRQGLVLPVVVLVDDPGAIASMEGYPAVVTPLAWSALAQLEPAIQSAIEKFLQLPALTADPPEAPAVNGLSNLSRQQAQLTEKLKARLGYMGVYYKRNPSLFLRHMNQADRDAFLAQLKADYQVIILAYFASPPKINLNEAIDAFVAQAFMADISVAHIVEIHMELMDNFSKQLKLEGRSEEILLDYRLTLIDVIAHLCEMYRRSIPREP